MDEAQLYVKVNHLQRKGIVDLLENFPYSKFKPVPNQRALDIGCGPGDTTESVLLPYLPADSQVVGVDIMPSMIKYAKENYGSNPRLKFYEYDLDCCDADVTDRLGKFDKIFSFWTLHWVQNQEVAFQNVYNLLKPGGEILFLFSGHVPTHTYRTIAQKPQWSNYLANIDAMISHFERSADPERIVKSVGFQNIQCNIQNWNAEFPSFSAISTTMQSLDPVLKRIPKNLVESFISDNKTEILSNFTKSDGGYTMPIKAITLYASK